MYAGKFNQNGNEPFMPPEKRKPPKLKLISEIEKARLQQLISDKGDSKDKELMRILLFGYDFMIQTIQHSNDIETRQSIQDGT